MASAVHLSDRKIAHSVPAELMPNPSLERTSTGMALGPRGSAGLSSASRPKHHAGSGPLSSNVGASRLTGMSRLSPVTPRR